jgi:NAD(P)-dependent dehydrogenase (short-subunit alcohol dehydrogenase family)
MCSCEGLVAIVTGGSGGIGRAVAVGLARSGSTVAVVGRTQEPLDEVVAQIRAAGGRALACVADITDEAQVENAVVDTVTKFGRLDVLVNNAGSSVNYGRAETLSLSQWNETVSANLTGAFLFSKAAAEPMSVGGGGSIVMVSSMDGLAGMPRMSAYSAAKAGVIGLTRALAAEWADRGIRVNCICPGGFQTNMTAASLERPGEGAAAIVLQRTPQHRYALPEEAVSSVLYFASPASSFTTGAVLAVDGGFTTV